MALERILAISLALWLPCAGAWAADVILNEYNAVSASSYLNGGDSAADEENGRASDVHFGRMRGNGGDWFELVVIKDHLDMRGWQLDLYEGGTLDETLTLTSHAIWRDLRSGTIITVSEDVASDISYDPAAGDWWINVQARDNADGLYIERSSFAVSSSNWQLRIRNAAGTVIFGPAGEGVSPASGIGGTEVCRLEADPSGTITPASDDYDDGSDFSTFGAPNRWGQQSVKTLRTVAPATATITLLEPQGPKTVDGGELVTVRWQSTNLKETVRVEFSIDAGLMWHDVYPPNTGNTGRYTWLVPLVESDDVLVRVSSTTRPSVYDVSNAAFVIRQSIVAAAMEE